MSLTDSDRTWLLPVCQVAPGMVRTLDVLLGELDAEQLDDAARQALGEYLVDLGQRIQSGAWTVVDV